ncbi:MAG: aldo/keto reductase [Verrucomicrobia bacterium]|nr:aldo/keto reductase [Verrucomicrobiota bacterium]
MLKVHIPKTDLVASVLGLGTDYFGSTVSRDVAMQVMDFYIEAGGNVIDTAELYARWIPGGEHQSERVIGEWLRDRRMRDRIILSTKGAHPNLDSMHIPRMSKAEIQSDLNSSLKRLGVDCIDIYWLHRDAPGYPIEEVLETLESFRRAGKVRYSGFSNWSQSRAEEAYLTAQRLGIKGFIASQNMWSLARVNLAHADPTWDYIDEPFARWHVARGVAAFPYLTQANGYFRRLDLGTLMEVPADARVRLLFDHQENRDRFQRIRNLQRKYGLTVGQVVLGYLRSQPFPVFPLVGPKNLSDLGDCLQSVETRLSAADVLYLEQGNGAEALGTPGDSSSNVPTD